MQPIPLTFTAMFHQYFQLAERLRRHYLSPRVLFCLLTGKFVPPINRRNLYSLQYSMLPAKRSGIMDVWRALNLVPPKPPSVPMMNGKRFPAGGLAERRTRGH